jgi:curved DNA-binding protein CbpA
MLVAKESIDYYALLGIPRTADDESIRRAYRSRATSLHPDNPNSGDVESFLLLQQAFRILTDPASRARHDSSLTMPKEEPVTVFELNRFSVAVDAEMKRRLALLALLYQQRREQDEHPGMSVLEMEQRLAFHREDLNFILWYLCAKELIRRELNSEYTLTARGADFVEAHCHANETSS